jgi:large subunit ribosomal protein L24
MKIKTHVKKGDQVKIIAGNSRGKTGTVVSVDAAKGKVVVEGARTVIKATRASEKNPDGGLIEQDGAVHISNVQKLG